MLHENRLPTKSELRLLENKWSTNGDPICPVGNWFCWKVFQVSGNPALFCSGFSRPCWTTNMVFFSVVFFVLFFQGSLGTGVKTWSQIIIKIKIWFYFSFFWFHTEKGGQSASDVTNTTVCVCVRANVHNQTHTHTFSDRRTHKRTLGLLDCEC